MAYRMNWSIVRVAEWLLARDYEQYISAYRKGEDSKYYEINDINDIEDIATEYLLKRTLDIGYSAICTEGTTETTKDFYKAYYKIDKINNHHILSRLELDFNEIYNFSYSTDTKGYVRAINRKLFNIIDGYIISTPSVTPTKSDPYEQYLVELNQLRIDDIRNNADTESIEQQLIEAHAKIDSLEQSKAASSFPIDSSAIVRGEDKTYEQIFDTLIAANNKIIKQAQNINNLNRQLEKQADNPADKHLYDWQAMDKNQYPPELHLTIEIWKKYYQAGDIEYITQFNTGKFNRIAKEFNLKDGNLKDRIRTLLTPLVRKLKAPSLIESFEVIDIIHIDKLEED